MLDFIELLKEQLTRSNIFKYSKPVFFIQVIVTPSQLDGKVKKEETRTGVDTSIFSLWKAETSIGL